MKKKATYNNVRLGLLLGMIAPVAGFFILYALSSRGNSLGDFVDILMNREKLSSVISLSAIPNLLLFFIFIWLNYLYSARGVLASTLLFALIVIFTKFLT